MINKFDWDKFRNDPRIKNLPPQEQARQYFLRQSDRMMESSFTNAVAAASSAAGAGGGSGNRRMTFVDTLESEIVMFISSEGTYKYYILDFINGTISNEIDTGVPGNFYVDDYYTFQNAGYVYLFNDGNNKNILFLKSSGEKIELVSFNSDYSYQHLDGRWIVIINNSSRELWYFNGTNLYKDDQLLVNVYYNLGSSLDYTNFDGLFLSTSGDGFTRYYLIGDNGVSLFKTLLSTDIIGGTSSLSTSAFLYSKSNFVAFSTRNSNNFEEYLLEVYNTTTGDSIFSLDIMGLSPSNIYDVSNVYPYGYNKMAIIYENSSDIDVPYLIVNINGDTNEVLIESHERGLDYQNKQILYNRINEGDFRQSTTNVNNIAVIFYSVSGSTDYLADVNKCDISYYFEVNSSFQLYQYATASGKSISIYGYGIIPQFTEDCFLFYINEGDDVVKMLSIISDDIFPTSLGITNSEISGYEQQEFGENLGFRANIDNKSIIYYIDSIGSTYSQLSIDELFGMDWDYSSLRVNGVESGITHSWCINENKIWTGLDYYSESRNTTEHYNGFNTRPGNLMIYNRLNSILNGIMITKQSISDNFTIKSDWLEIGPYSILSAYSDDLRDSKITVALYSLSGELLQKFESEHYDVDRFDIVGRRASVITATKGFDGNLYVEYTLVLLTETDVKSKTFKLYDETNTWYLYNDYVWFNDWY